MRKVNAVVVNLSMFDPFEVLGLKKEYSLDLKTLEQHYFKGQRNRHPDRLTHVQEGEKAEALKQSAILNQAYLLLKNPLQRAEWILKAEGLDLLNPDAETLLQVMNWNERFESGENVKPELCQEEEKLFKDLEMAFEEQAYTKARFVLCRLIYVQKVLKDIELSHI